MDFSIIDNLLRIITVQRLIGLSLLASVGYYFIYIHSHGLTSSAAQRRQEQRLAAAVPDAPPSGSVTRPPSRTVSEATPSLDSGEQLEAQIRRARNDAIRQIVDEAESSFQLWEKAVADWNRMKPEILDGDRGRAIAENPESLPMVLELIRLGSVRSDQIATYRVQLEEVSTVIENTLTRNPGAEVTMSTREMLESLKNEISQKGEELARVVRELQRQSQATRDVAPGKRTLRQAMGEQELIEQQKMLALEMAAREQARKETADRLLAVERRRQQAEAQLRETELNAEVERLRAEKEAKELSTARLKAEQEALAARENLEAEFARDRAEINRLLSPFVTPAPYMLVPPHGFLYSGQNTGISLSAIGKCGALEKTDEGLDIMSRLNESNRRPLGDFPKYVQSEWRRNPRVKAKLERAQDLLLKYGDLLVEKGLLEK